MGAVYIMWLRQIKKYWRSKPRMIGSLAQPILFLVAFGFGFGSIYAKAGDGNYLDFLAPGIIAMSILFTAMFTGIEIIWDRQFGFLKETLVAPVTRTRIMLGRTLGGATVAMLQGMVVLLICLLLGFRPDWAYLPLALVFMFVIALMFTALGTAIASKLEDMQAFPLIMNFLIMPTFFLSGALFPLSGLPKALEIATKFNPLTYGVEGIRSLMTGVLNASVFLDFTLIALITTVILAIGIYLFSKIEI